jgi:hypothetical protein
MPYSKFLLLTRDNYPRIFAENFNRKNKKKSKMKNRDKFQDFKSPAMYAIAVVAVVVFSVFGVALADNSKKIASHEAEIERIEAEKEQIIRDYENRKIREQPLPTLSPLSPLSPYRK